MADLKTVCDYLTPSEILAQLGEECAEGAQAALKLRRAYDGTNPTPKNVEDCLNNLQEEFADMMLCLRVFCEAENISFDDFLDGMGETMVQKSDRWVQRLENVNKRAYLVRVETVEPLTNAFAITATSDKNARDIGRNIFHQMNPGVPMENIRTEVVRKEA